MFFAIDVKNGSSDDEEQDSYDGGHGLKAFGNHAGGGGLCRVHGNGRGNNGGQGKNNAEVAFHVLPLFSIAEGCCGKEKEGHHHSSGKDDSAEKKQQC